MQLEELKNTIIGMDSKSEEFFELFKVAADKYFTFEKPDSLQQAAALIYKWMMSQEEAQIITVAHVVQQVFLMRHDKTKSCTGTLGFKDETFFFDIYTTETEKDKMSEMLIKAHDSMKKGNITVNGKKPKFGKNYFKKEPTQ